MANDDEPLTVDEPRLIARAFESSAAATTAVWNPVPDTVPRVIRWPGKRLTNLDIAGQGRLDHPASVSLAANDIAVLSFETV